MSADGTDAPDRHAAPRDLAPTDTRTPVREEDGRRVLDLPRFAPYLLASLAATLSARSSARYRAEFGVGVSDWRVIATLAQAPGATASRIVDTVALDKAAVSRALAGLSQRRLVDAVAGERDPRRKSWFLTEDGWRLHDRLLRCALEQEADLTQGISARDMDTCLSVLRRMQANVVPPAEEEQG